jgi:hypothetical protein
LLADLFVGVDMLILLAAPDVRAVQRGARIVACWKRLEDAFMGSTHMSTYVPSLVAGQRFWDSASTQGYLS